MGAHSVPVTEFDPGGCVITCLLPATHLAIHAGSHKAARDRRAEQQVVDAETGVARPGIPEVFPKGVDALVWVNGAQGVGPALRDQVTTAYSNKSNRLQPS